MALTINVQTLNSSGCAPALGAYVDIWHCDAKGIYSDEPTYNPGGGTGNVNTSGQKFLRGYQITDGSGQVQFTTIYPGWYSGRTIHIHVRVRTYSGTTVLSNYVTQIFFDEATNNAVLASPAYSRSTARDTTNANDMVYQTANQTRLLATTTGSVGAGYSATFTVGATLTIAAAAAPTIATGGVGNAVSGAPGVTPGAWISIYGANFSTTTRTLISSDIVNNLIPTSLGGVSVQIDGKPAYMQYVGPTQINVLAPADTNTGTVAVTVTNAAGTSNRVTTNQLAVLPGLSVLSNYVRAVRYPDGALINGTGNFETGYTTSAAAGPGDIVALYGTGFGPTSATNQDGAIFTGAYPTTNNVIVTIGGVSAHVLFAGLVAPGLYQINVMLPSTLSDGDQAVVATVAGVSTQSTALLKIAASAALKTQGVGESLSWRLFGRGPKSRAFLPLSARAGVRIEDIIRLGGLFGPEHRAGAERDSIHHES